MISIKTQRVFQLAETPFSSYSSSSSSSSNSSSPSSYSADVRCGHFWQQRCGVLVRPPRPRGVGRRRGQRGPGAFVLASELFGAYYLLLNPITSKVPDDLVALIICCDGWGLTLPLDRRTGLV